MRVPETKGAVLLTTPARKAHSNTKYIRPIPEQEYDPPRQSCRSPMKNCSGLRTKAYFVPRSFGLMDTGALVYPTLMRNTWKTLCTRALSDATLVAIIVCGDINLLPEARFQATTRSVTPLAPGVTLQDVTIDDVPLGVLN